MLVLTTFDDRETVDAAVGSGADGYILKEMEDDKVIQSVKAVCAGIRVLEEAYLRGCAVRWRPAKNKGRHGRGFDAQGTGYHAAGCPGNGQQEIAGALFLAEGTVRNNISRLLEKLKLKDRTQLAVFAVKHNLDE